MSSTGVTPPAMGRPFNPTAVRAAIDRFVAASPYHACLLLVSPTIGRLQAAQVFICETYGWPLLSVGSALAEGLMAIPAQRRARKAQRILRSALGTQSSDPLLCTDIDLLFHPSLEQDPLRLFRDASRHARLVVSWPGTFQDGVLAYAVESHGHYRTWSDPDLSSESILTL